jgi:uncharacterized protein
MHIPSWQEIRRLHEKHAPTPEALDLVLTHCEIVWAVAEQLLDGLDADLVRAGCLLHDIGVYRLGHDDPYLRHGVLGHELLAEEGLPTELRRFCSHHMGVGLSRDDVRRQGLPIPPADYLAESAEERLVMYADKFHSKTSPPTFVTADTYALDVRRFGADKPARFASLRAEFGEPDLTALIGTYGHAVR